MGRPDNTRSDDYPPNNLLTNFLNLWMKDEPATICPEQLGLTNHCDSKNCIMCKTMALRTIGIDLDNDGYLKQTKRASL